MIKYTKVNQIEVQDWNNLVRETYGKPYNLQQQDGCQPRGIVHLSIPDLDDDEFMNDSIPEVVNGSEMGVKFQVWLDRDPKQKLSNPGDQEDYCIGLFWERNFYPDLQTVANDLHKKGLIEEGDYQINIDW